MLIYYVVKHWSNGSLRDILIHLPYWRPHWTPPAMEAELEMPPLLPVPGALHPATPNAPPALLLLLAASEPKPLPLPLPRPGPVVPLVGFFQPRQLLHNDSASELQLQRESSSKRMESSKLKRSISSGFHSLLPPPPPLAAFASAPAPPAAAPPAAAALLLLLRPAAATAAAPPEAASALLLLLLPLRFARLKLSFKRSASLWFIYSAAAAAAGAFAVSPSVCVFVTFGWIFAFYLLLLLAQSSISFLLSLFASSL